MASELMPAWIRAVGLANPVNWAVDGARDAMLGVDWPQVGAQALNLAAFVLLCGIFATQAFSLYRRTT
jgi:ABC-2 type transport system permease protein